MLLRIRELSKSYRQGAVFQHLSLEVKAGETLAILGRSGCGKTTLLKTIAGLETPDGGGVFLRDKNLAGIPPQQRGIVYLYQEPLLFPHLNVFENIAFGLRLQKKTEAEVRTQTIAMLENLDLAGLENRRPDALSGGQKQRVAFGRALIIRPEILLLDEPFGNLDVETRSAMQQLLKQLMVTHHISAIFVTHDLKEAVIMGDRLAYMENGKLEVFADLNAFIADPRTGMSQEINFWKNLNKT